MGWELEDGEEGEKRVSPEILCDVLVVLVSVVVVVGVVEQSVLTCAW